VPDATISVYWLKKSTDGEVKSVELLNCKSSANGTARGSYDKKSVPADETIWSGIKKDGYESYDTDGLRSQYVIARKFKAEDVARIAKLSGDKQRDELKEMLAGDFDDEGENSVTDLFFFHEQQLRPALRSLVMDTKVGPKASQTLVFIGVPEDLRLIVQHAPKPKRKLFEDRWAYEVVTALLEPSTDEEWSFLEKCAANEYDDLWVDAGAIETLKLVASPKSSEILQRVLKKNPDRSRSIEAALDYSKSNPLPLADKDLIAAGKKVAQAIKIGDWQENKKPRFNESGDKALIDCKFIAGRDLLIHTATFHKVGEVWKLRGVRETMQALLARSPEKKSDDNSK